MTVPSRTRTLGCLPSNRARKSSVAPAAPSITQVGGARADEQARLIDRAERRADGRLPRGARPASRGRLGARLLGVGHLREEVVDELELVVGVGRDDAGMGLAERLQGLADRGQALGHDLDDDTPPIGRVASCAARSRPARGGRATRVTAPVERFSSSARRPAVTGSRSTSSSSALMSDSERPRRTATVWPKTSPVEVDLAERADDGVERGITVHLTTRP